jgi:hypothetical protein
LLRRDRKKDSRNISKNAIERLANGKVSSRLKLAIHMPEGVVGDRPCERKQDQLWKIELQPESSCVGKARPFVVGCNMGAEPAMLANLFNETLLVFVELRRLRVESCSHNKTCPCWFKMQITPLSLRLSTCNQRCSANGSKPEMLIASMLSPLYLAKRMSASMAGKSHSGPEADMGHVGTPSAARHLK